MENLNNLVNTISEQEDENEIVKLEVFKLAVNAIETYARKFKADSVTKEEMLNLLYVVKADTEAIVTTTDKTTQIKEDIMERLDKAEMAVRNAFPVEGEVSE